MFAGEDREVGWEGKCRDRKSELAGVCRETEDKGSSYLRSADLPCSGEVVS